MLFKLKVIKIKFENSCPTKMIIKEALYQLTEKVCDINFTLIARRPTISIYLKIIIFAKYFNNIV